MRTRRPRTHGLERPSDQYVAEAAGVRSRFGYDARWWGRAAEPAAARTSYWATTRRPLPSLIFILPLLASYEVGVVWVGQDAAESLRTGLDSWIRLGLASFGMTDRWLPPLVLVMALLGWQAVDRKSWRFRPSCLVGMAVESLVLAVALIGMSRLVDLGLDRLDTARQPLLAGESPHPLTPILGFLGAGIYEEAVFRLALIPLCYAGLRLLLVPRFLAGVLAVTASALLFSVAHHAGAPGEPFTWYAFFFRWIAGIYFAWVFVARGFGVAVGCHAAYDVLIGWLDWTI